MRKSALLVFTISIICFSSIRSQSLESPFLNKKTTTKTLVIDSIPVTITKNYRLTGINKNNNDYRFFIDASRFSEYPSFGISRTRPYLVVPNNAFTHKSLFDPVVYGVLGEQTWDNPLGSDSFGVGVVAGSLQLLSNIFN